MIREQDYGKAWEGQSNGEIRTGIDDVGASQCMVETSGMR